MPTTFWVLSVPTLIFCAFRRFFEQIVEMCVEAGLVRGEDLYFDATKVDANASLDSIAPRFAVEEHLDGLFEREPPGEHNGGARAPVDELWALPAADDEAPAGARTRPRETGSPGTGARGGR